MINFVEDRRMGIRIRKLSLNVCSLIRCIPPPWRSFATVRNFAALPLGSPLSVVRCICVRLWSGSKRSDSALSHAYVCCKDKSRFCNAQPLIGLDCLRLYVVEIYLDRSELHLFGISSRKSRQHEAPNCTFRLPE